TGDPVAPRVGAPVPGIGQTTLPGGSAVTAGGRHPIGFPPPPERTAQPPPGFPTAGSFPPRRARPRARAPARGADGRTTQPSRAAPEAAPTPDHDEIVPFFRREISFRRKKEAEPVVAAVDDGAPIVTEAQQPHAVVEPEVEVSAVEPEPDASVPFYRRELGF